MAGWFYLGSARDHHLSKDESHRDEIYRNGGSKGFELWPQQYGVANSDHVPHHFGGGGEESGRRVNLIDFSDECWRSGVTSAMRPGGSGGGGGTNCQDCGNQAKKDCTHLRCRTCCKSRGFQCQTHLKSTWVPAAKRRERHQQLAGMQQQQQPFRILENPKRPREEHDHPHHLQQQQQLVAARSAGLELGQHFPPEVTSPAVFRCVRVTGVDDSDEEFAYQTSVHIAGHVFKGILYDHGPEEGTSGGTHVSRYSGAGGGESSGAAHHHQQFSLMTATTTGNPSTLIDPSLFPAPLNAFMAGTQFFPPPRS